MLRVSQYWALLFISLYLWTAPVQAEYPVDIAGYATRIRGEVMIENAAGRHALALGQPLHIGDRIVTGSEARLEARMQDRTILTLGANTEFLIRQVQGVAPKQNGSLFELFKGVFRAVTAQTGAEPLPREDWRVQTPVATIGIRGTEVWGGFNLLDAGSETLDVVMLNGRGVYVESAGQRVELQQAGEGTTVEEAGQAPMPARTWGNKKIRAALRTVAW